MKLTENVSTKVYSNLNVLYMVDTIYPAHGNTLRKAGLAPPVFPTMGELWKNKMRSWRKIKKETSAFKRKLYFVVAYSRYFSTAIHRVIERLKNSFNLTWLRVQMSYHRFNNLAELLNGDLTAKIGRWIFSKYLMDR